ncbi:MAG: cation transporter [Chloroflexi bacterium HGW-Chloroflexi-10]|nr:MAG: cation transporter [Chloroflexi bacterium HGW-Chloroflexi-10]
MSQSTLSEYKHQHDFQADHSGNEKRTLSVVILTAAMMVAEIAAGTLFGSMALLADGWHMGTHTFALSVAFLAYWYARRHRNDPSFSFGTGKISALGGYTSAILLLVVAIAMAIESFERFFQPQTIRFEEAILVAVIGLVVNLVSARILGGEHDHHTGHQHEHDHNIRAAYLHVIADALTSILAIAALLAGRFFGWVWMDALMGIVGAVVISRWSIGLLKDTGQMLLDRNDAPHLAEEIRKVLEKDGKCSVTDLHLWEVSGHRFACILSIVDQVQHSPAVYKKQLAQFKELVHITVEVNR